MTNEIGKNSMAVAWLDGVRLRADVRSHRVIMDQPLDEGGRDQGMTPVEMFIASLGGCIGLFAAKFCQRHGISSEGLTIRMEWDYADQPHRVGRITVRVDLPAPLEPEMKTRLRKVLEGCTIHQSLAHPPEVSLVPP
jgi:putative redox protein